MRDYDKELREAVRRLLETTSTIYKDQPLVEIKELPNVGAAWNNAKGKPTAEEVLEWLQDKCVKGEIVSVALLEECRQVCGKERGE